MENSFIIEGITSVSALINNVTNQISNSPRRLTDVYFDMKKISKFDRTAYSRYVFLKENANKCNYTFHECQDFEFDSIVSGNSHGGIAGRFFTFEIPEISTTDILKNSIYCYVDGVDDPFNLGYIIRTMYTFGVSAIILPKNNKMNLFPDTVIKSSAGTTEKINIFTSAPESVCALFKERNYKIVSAALRDSVPCHEATLTSPLLVVIGGEKRGISSHILNNSDARVRIDYSIPFNGSLPSVCAASIIAYEISRQNSKSN